MKIEVHTYTRAAMIIAKHLLHIDHVKVMTARIEVVTAKVEVGVEQLLEL